MLSESEWLLFEGVASLLGGLREELLPLAERLVPLGGVRPLDPGSRLEGDAQATLWMTLGLDGMTLGPRLMLSPGSSSSSSLLSMGLLSLPLDECSDVCSAAGPIIADDVPLINGEFEVGNGNGKTADVPFGSKLLRAAHDAGNGSAPSKIFWGS
jgi:hypothetical protein